MDSDPHVPSTTYFFKVSDQLLSYCDIRAPRLIELWTVEREDHHISVPEPQRSWVGLRETCWRQCLQAERANHGKNPNHETIMLVPVAYNPTRPLMINERFNITMMHFGNIIYISDINIPK